MKILPSESYFESLLVVENGGDCVLFAQAGVRPTSACKQTNEIGLVERGP